MQEMRPCRNKYYAWVTICILHDHETTDGDMRVQFLICPFADLASRVQGRSASVAAWSMAERKPIIAGNWKMNPASIEEAVTLAEGIKEQAKTAHSEVSCTRTFSPHCQASSLSWAWLRRHLVCDTKRGSVPLNAAITVTKLRV